MNRWVFFYANLLSPQMINSYIYIFFIIFWVHFYIRLLRFKDFLHSYFSLNNIRSIISFVSAIFSLNIQKKNCNMVNMHEWLIPKKKVHIHNRQIEIIIQEVPMKVLISEEIECLIFFYLDN